MSVLRVLFSLVALLLLWSPQGFAVNNGSRFPDLTLLERSSGETVSFQTARQGNLAIIYVDYFNGGEAVDLSILARVTDKAIYKDRPDGPKIKVFTIGSMNTFPGESRFPILVDDAFAVPDRLGITAYPYVITVDCQGNVIGQLHFEPASDPADPIKSKGLLEPGKWQFIQGSIQRAVKSGACR